MAANLAPDAGLAAIPAPSSPGARERAAFPAAVAVALAGHLVLLVALAHSHQRPVGAGGFDAEAMSVEVSLLPSTALASRPQAPVAASGAAAGVDAIEGVTAAAATAAPAAAAATPPPAAAAPASALLQAKPEVPVPDALALPTGDSKPDVATRIATPAPEASVTATDLPDTSRPPPKADATRVEAAPPAEALPAPPSGGAAARAAADEKPTAGAAAVSPGQIAAYAKSIVSALARTAPKGAGAAGRGTVLVEFAVTEDGGLDEVRVKQSSGRPRLDDLALAAVRSTRFPAAPPGMSPRDRTYVVPYHFR